MRQGRRNLYPDNKGLAAKIIQRINEKGRITFDEFMEDSLYYPGLGYYESGKNIIGADGDYYTSPDIHPVFGRLIAKQLNQMAQILGGDRFDILEMGAGKGILARDILDCISKNYPDLFEKTNYIILDRSTALRNQQESLLSQFSGPAAKKVCWIQDLSELPEGFVGSILSNEFFDALPVHRVTAVNGTLYELFVTHKDGKFIETADRPPTEDLSRYLERIRISPVEGSIAEINLEAVRIISRLGKILDKGFIITIDYGHHANDLFSPARRFGTLLCYHKHTLGADPFIRIGEQDITTHIDFTSLSLSGRDFGLEVTGFTDQMSFLMGLGIAQEMETAPIEEFEAMKRLTLPNDMGRTFKVLIQHKGIERPSLDGMRFRAFFDPTILPVQEADIP